MATEKKILSPKGDEELPGLVRVWGVLIGVAYAEGWFDSESAVEAA